MITRYNIHDEMKSNLEEVRSTKTFLAYSVLMHTGVDTVLGVIQAIPGDFIVLDENDNLYVYKQAAFHDRFEPAPEDVEVVPGVETKKE